MQSHFAVTLLALAATAALTAPSTPASVSRLRLRPPPAYLEVAGRMHQLGYSSFCWQVGGRGLCADYLPPSCRSRRQPPRIQLAAGSLVELRLGFLPRSLTGAFSRPDGGKPLVQQRLPAARRTRFRVSRAGLLTVSAAAKGGGDASYIACLASR